MQITTTNDGSKTLFSERYQQTYHSTHGAVTESRTIFIEGSGLQDRFAQSRSSQQPLRILEIGFGLGLNFLLSADLARQCEGGLAYHAIENDPIPVTTLEKLDYARWLRNPALAASLYEQLNHTANDSVIRFNHAGLATGITLCLHKTLGDIDNASGNRNNLFDIVYLDAFSPDTNPDCWTDTLINHLFESMAPGGVLVTYSAKGRVRRSLQATGFSVSRLPGPPGKREFLKAERRQSTIE